MSRKKKHRDGSRFVYEISLESSVEFDPKDGALIWHTPDGSLRTRFDLIELADDMLGWWTSGGLDFEGLDGASIHYENNHKGWDEDEEPDDSFISIHTDKQSLSLGEFLTSTDLEDLQSQIERWSRFEIAGDGEQS